MDIFRNRNSKKGQAAIEFLMTYGWMLLIVLIVGALIFSFIDFGSLLPARVDLSGSFKGDASRIVASANPTDTLQLVIKYVGPGSVLITNASQVTLSPLGSKVCTFESMTNAAGTTVTAASLNGATDVSFVNGQESTVTFDCSGGGGLIQGDTLEGRMKVSYADSRTPTLTLSSSGNLRVGITE